MTATGSERCTATPWRGSGRGFGTSSGRSGVSTKRTENSTSSFSSGLTTSRRSPTSSCGYCSDARQPPNWLHEPNVLQHPDDDLAAALQHPEDRRLLLGQRPPATLPFQAPPSPGASFFLTASGWPLCPATT